MYWYPIYAFIRRKGNNADRACDLTQDFFTHLFEKEVLATVDRSKGVSAHSCEQPAVTS